MELNVKIDPEAINKEIVDAVAKSAIGEQLKKIIEEKAKEWGNTYNNPLKPIIEAEISNLMRKIVRDNYMTQIEEFVKKNMTEKFTEDILNNMWKKLNDIY